VVDATHVITLVVMESIRQGITVPRLPESHATEGSGEIRRMGGRERRPTMAFVTVSYGPDRDRCSLLCRSLDALAPATADHVIVVDRADVAQFRGLESSRRRVVATEDVLPSKIWRLEARRVGLRSNVFVHMGKPVRGWLVQQLAKLAACRDVEADVIIHADSDVALVRPFEVESLFDEDDRIRLYRAPRAIDNRLPAHVRWHRTAERLLGIAPCPIPLPDYITSLVPWRRDNALALLDFLEQRFGRSWLRTIAGAWDFSEYILYGRFVSEVLGEDAHQFPTPTSLCLDYWEHEVLSEQDIEKLLDGMSPDQVALSITAKAGMRPDSYASQLERRWEASDSTTGVGG
jgi:hypothetical protein